MHPVPEPIVVDARAKIVWGEKPEDVLAFLQSKAVGDEDARALLEQLMKERTALIRADGVKKTWMGALFVLMPTAYYFLSMSVGYWSLKFFAVLILIGFVGVVKIMDGLSMLFRPRAVRGDLSNAEN